MRPTPPWSPPPRGSTPPGLLLPLLLLLPTLPPPALLPAALAQQDPGLAPATPAPLPPAPPPLTPPPLPGVGQVLPSLAEPDPQLEAALRQRLFNGPFDLVPGKQPDPDGTEWQQARTRGERPDCREVGDLRYLHNRVDLDGDGEPEVLAAVVGSYACGSRGCSLFIFRRQLPGLELVNELDSFESPLVIDGRSSFGWQDLTMPAALALGGPPGEQVHWRFDGRAYSRTAAEAPPETPLPAETSPPFPPPRLATVVLQLDPLPFEQLGHPLRCEP